AYLNEHFIPIKVDREERPDIDNLYMAATQAMTGRGGWPMSVFMTPDRKPFFCGTYFPPFARQGMQGFNEILISIHEAWLTKRTEIDQSADQVSNFLLNQAKTPEATDGSPALDAAFLDSAYEELSRSYDSNLGGFGRAPKFPTAHRITFLLRYHHRTQNQEALAMATHSLDAMANGGIHDHLVGGFHRYSTDAQWLAPHFEKMLYDQASLALAYTEAWLLTKDPNYEAVARGILDYVQEYMTHPDGGFYSAEDADSEGVEGKFYVWSTDEIEAEFSAEEAAAFIKNYRMTPHGNWEETNILHTEDLSLFRDPKMQEARKKLLKIRDKRIRPHLDDKVVVSWNAYMIEAFAKAGWAFGDASYLESAEKAEGFVRKHLYENGRLLRHYRNGTADVDGYLEDYAYMGRALLYLYETTFEVDYLKQAKFIAEEMKRLFLREEGGFLFTGSDNEALIAPIIEVYDGAMPSGNSIATSFLLRLGHLTADSDMKDLGWATLNTFGPTLAESPSAYMEMVSALDFALGPNTEVVIAGEPGDTEVESMLSVLRDRFDPNQVVAQRPVEAPKMLLELVPYLEAQTAIEGQATAFVCRNYACKLPVQDAAGLEKQLQE
ncbi:MAG: thioredoxin domain-containing protein, partial [Candidatus Eisenbacteria bacterium]|nr:thioredoxin domain-containing protein [Candidatus Eisenbacteria bacterium]